MVIIPLCTTTKVFSGSDLRRKEKNYYLELEPEEDKMREREAAGLPLRMGITFCWFSMSSPSAIIVVVIDKNEIQKFVIKIS